MKKIISVVAIGLALLLTGCAPSQDSAPYDLATHACHIAYEKAPNFSQEHGGTDSICTKDENTRGKAEFITYWSDPHNWQDDMMKIYQNE